MMSGGRSFDGWLDDREELPASCFISALRGKVCENAWNDDRLCFLHVTEGCPSCSIMPRPTIETWRTHIAERPLSEIEQVWVSRYERSLGEK